MNLDDLPAIAAADPGGALRAIEGTPEQWAEALRRARAATGLPPGEGVRTVVFCGMGGSGIAGDVLVAVSAGRAPVPVTVVKGYDIPAYVGPDTLVICASYSGNTEETLSCFEQARARKARIVTLTTGGKLADRAAELGLPRIAPLEGIQPRAALASLTVPTLVVMERLGLLPGIGEDIAETEDVLAARTKELGREAPGNEAKGLASRIEGKLPLVWGQDGFLSVAAIRWRCQLNENAKIPAFSSVLPELDHNELVGYDPGVGALDQIALIVLRAPGEHPRVAKRVDTTLDLMRDRVGRVDQVHAVGESALARLMSIAILGDFTSAYLAFLRGVDPTPVVVIEGLKRTLAS